MIEALCRQDTLNYCGLSVYVPVATLFLVTLFASATETNLPLVWAATGRTLGSWQMCSRHGHLFSLNQAYNLLVYQEVVSRQSEG